MKTKLKTESKKLQKFMNEHTESKTPEGTPLRDDWLEKTTLSINCSDGIMTKIKRNMDTLRTLIKHGEKDGNSGSTKKVRPSYKIA